MPGQLIPSAAGAALPPASPIYSRRNFCVPGTWYDSLETAHASAQGMAGTANYMQFVPYVVTRAQAFDRIGVGITSPGSAGSTMRLGVYQEDEDTGRPGALLVGSGAIALDSTGAKEAAISVTLEPGIMYYLALLMSANASFLAFPQANNSNLGAYQSNSLQPYTSIIAAQAYGPLPDPAPSELSIDTYAEPLIRLRAA